MAEKKKDEPANFESSLTRLEAIVKEMEEGNLPLEKMMAHFEEGTKLVKFCSQKLNEVEKKIDLLVKKGDEFVAQPYETESKDN